MSNRGLVVPVDGRRMISTGVGIALVVAGAIVRFAVPATFPYGLNAPVVSVINAGRRIRPDVVAAGLGALGEGSPHRSLVYPVVEYVPHAQQPGRQVAVLIPETPDPPMALPDQARYRKADEVSEAVLGAL